MEFKLKMEFQFQGYFEGLLAILASTFLEQRLS